MESRQRLRVMVVAAVLVAATFGMSRAGAAQPLYSITDLGTLPDMSYSVATDVNAAGDVLLPPVSGGLAPLRTFVWSNDQQIEVGPFPGQPPFTSAIAINDAAQATGGALVCSPCVAHAFLWTNGTMIDIGTVGGLPQSAGIAVNTSGQVAGYAYESPGITARGRAFLYSNGATIDLGTLPGGEASAAYGINDLGQVVGGSRSGTSTHVHAVLWTNGTIVDLDNDPAHGSSATGINNASQVMGQIWWEDEQIQFRAFRYSDGVMTNLGTLGGDYSYAYRMNAAGHIVGEATVALGPGHAFLDTGGPMVDLGTLGGSFSIAYGINADDHVVGKATTAVGAEHAFVYRDGTMYDLNERLLANPGWTVLSGATDINDAGQIVGWGTIGSEVHGFRLDPVVPTD